MLIIDHAAEAKFIKVLEEIRTQLTPSTLRALHLKTKAAILGHLTATQIREAILNATSRHVSELNPEVFLCEDGDVFILAPAMLQKDARLVMLDLATRLAVPVSHDWVEFHELDIVANRLLAEFEQRERAKHEAMERAQKQKEEDAARRKREAILKGDALASAQDIAARRRQRDASEILVIEDDAFSRRLVEKVLEHRFGLTSLATAERALATYAKIAPDIVFLDINLPDVSGHDLLMKMIAMDPEAYIIMLSGNADRDNIVQAMSQGAKGFVAKPFSKEKLFQYIERCPTIQLQGV